MEALFVVVNKTEYLERFYQSCEGTLRSDDPR